MILKVTKKKVMMKNRREMNLRTKNSIIKNPIQILSNKIKVKKNLKSSILSNPLSKARACLQTWDLTQMTKWAANNFLKNKCPWIILQTIRIWWIWNQEWIWWTITNFKDFRIRKYNRNHRLQAMMIMMTQRVLIISQLLNSHYLNSTTKYPIPIFLILLKISKMTNSHNLETRSETTNNNLKLISKIVMMRMKRFPKMNQTIKRSEANLIGLTFYSFYMNYLLLICRKINFYDCI